MLTRHLMLSRLLRLALAMVVTLLFMPTPSISDTTEPTFVLRYALVVAEKLPDNSLPLEKEFRELRESDVPWALPAKESDLLARLEASWPGYRYKIVELGSAEFEPGVPCMVGKAVSQMNPMVDNTEAAMAKLLAAARDAEGGGVVANVFTANLATDASCASGASFVNAKEVGGYAYKNIAAQWNGSWIVPIQLGHTYASGARSYDPQTGRHVMCLFSIVKVDSEEQGGNSK